MNNSSQVNTLIERSRSSSACTNPPLRFLLGSMSMPRVALTMVRHPFNFHSCNTFSLSSGTRVWANPRAIVAMMRQCNTIDVTRRSPSYEVRLAKYSSRDFEVYVPSLRRAEVDPTVRIRLRLGSVDEVVLTVIRFTNVPSHASRVLLGCWSSRSSKILHLAISSNPLAESSVVARLSRTSTRGVNVNIRAISRPTPLSAGWK